MKWHAQPLELHVRGYSSNDFATGADAFALRAPFDAIMTVQLLGNGKAYIHGMHAYKNIITRADLRELLLMLKRDHGVSRVTAERNGEDVFFDSAMAEENRPDSGVTDFAGL